MYMCTKKKGGGGGSCEEVVIALPDVIVFCPPPSTCVPFYNFTSEGERSSTTKQIGKRKGEAEKE